MAVEPDRSERIQGEAIAELLYAAADLHAMAAEAEAGAAALVQIAQRLEAAATRLESDSDVGGGLRLVVSDEAPTTPGSERRKR